MLLRQAGLSHMLHFVTAYGAVGIGILVAVGLGLLAVGLLSCIPAFMAYTGIILGGLGCVAVGVFVLLSDHE